MDGAYSGAGMFLAGRCVPGRDVVLRLQRFAGNKAVISALARSAGGNAPTPHTVQRAPKKPAGGILVHPISGLTADEIVRMIRRNKNFPDFLKKSLRSRGGSLVLVGKRPQKPPGTFSEFLKPFLDAISSPEWEITTADSKIKVTGSVGRGLHFSQVITPHLLKTERLGATHKTGPGETTFTPDPLHSEKEEIIFGWTVPASSTEQLKAHRGLLVIVTKITATDPEGRTKVFTPTENEVLESIMHEIAVHAGRINEGKPDEHGVREVEDIAEDVRKFFRYSAEASGGVAPSTTATAIFEFVGAKESVSP